MLTPAQEAWIQKLPVDKRVTILPFDTTAEEKYQKTKQQIQSALGAHIPVIHRGSTSLGISGQDEIDVYIPVEPERFDTLFEELKKLFGEPRSVLPLQRIRFVITVDGKHIDLFLSNNQHKDWIEGVAFEEICNNRPDIKFAYQKLKEEMNGWTVQDFYRKKAEFIDAVLRGEI